MVYWNILLACPSQVVLYSVVLYVSKIVFESEKNAFNAEGFGFICHRVADF